MKLLVSFSKILRNVALLIMLIVVLVLIINWSIFDETLSPEVEALIASTPSIHQDLSEQSKNSYFAILGIKAADNKDILETGIQLIAQYRINRDEKGLDALTSADLNAIMGQGGLDKAWQTIYPKCNSRTQPGCFATLVTHINNAPIRDPRLLTMLKRYDQIIRMPIYRDIPDPSVGAPIPSFNELLWLGQIKLAQLFAKESMQPLLQHVQTDINYWRMVLSNSQMLITKMVAVAALRNDLHYLSASLNEKVLLDEDIRTISALLQSLTLAEKNIAESFQYEHRAMHQYFHNYQSHNLSYAFGQANYPVKWMIQKNATSNAFYRYSTQPMVKLSQLDAAAFARELDAGNGSVKCCITKIADMIGYSPSSIYNLGGKILLRSTIGKTEDYIARIHDLDGMLALIRLQLEIKQRSPADIQSLVENSLHTNPYTAKPMNFDAESNKLNFQCYDPHALCEVSL